jgi:hypothetical protein
LQESPIYCQYIFADLCDTQSVIHREKIQFDFHFKFSFKNLATNIFLNFFLKYPNALLGNEVTVLDSILHLMVGHPMCVEGLHCGFADSANRPQTIVRRFLTRRASDLRILVHREEIF